MDQQVMIGGIEKSRKAPGHIRSYVRRQGRMMPTQKIALSKLWPFYGCTEDNLIDLDKLFGRQAPLYLEIGFGMGGSLLEMARSNPENNYYGVEVHLPGVGQLLHKMHKHGITNVRVDNRDIIDVLELLPSCSVNEVYLFFPDPWPKKKHHKRRLVQHNFVKKIHRVLKSRGQFHAVTDCESYALHMQQIMDNATGFKNSRIVGHYYSSPVRRPRTRFEMRGLQKGHAIRELQYIKAASN